MADSQSQARLRRPRGTRWIVVAAVAALVALGLGTVFSGPIVSAVFPRHSERALALLPASPLATVMTFDLQPAPGRIRPFFQLEAALRKQKWPDFMRQSKGTPFERVSRLLPALGRSGALVCENGGSIGFPGVADCLLAWQIRDEAAVRRVLAAEYEGPRDMLESATIEGGFLIASTGSEAAALGMAKRRIVGSLLDQEGFREALRTAGEADVRLINRYASVPKPGKPADSWWVGGMTLQDGGTMLKTAGWTDGGEAEPGPLAIDPSVVRDLPPGAVGVAVAASPVDLQMLWGMVGFGSPVPGSRPQIRQILRDAAPAAMHDLLERAMDRTVSGGVYASLRDGRMDLTGTVVSGIESGPETESAFRLAMTPSPDDPNAIPTAKTGAAAYDLYPDKVAEWNAEESAAPGAFLPWHRFPLRPQFRLEGDRVIYSTDPTQAGRSGIGTLKPAELASLIRPGTVFAAAADCAAMNRMTEMALAASEPAARPQVGTLLGLAFVGGYGRETGRSTVVVRQEKGRSIVEANLAQDHETLARMLAEFARFSAGMMLLPPDVNGVVSSLNARSRAMQIYAADWDGSLPPQTVGNLVEDALDPYMAAVTQTSDHKGQRLQWNSRASGVRLKDVADPSELILFFSRNPLPDGTYPASFADWTVRMITGEEMTRLMPGVQPRSPQRR
ncbi:MAG: hypothetical protein MH204_02375 [Fimbriimonadaceae bacterium]|nr:hypothetical protein [Fimbriimonadaceae bacterium]